MIDFIVDIFVEIASFFLDKVIDKFAKKKSRSAMGGKNEQTEGNAEAAKCNE